MMRALRIDTRSTERATLAVAALCALTGAAMAARPGVAPLVASAALLAALSLDGRRGVIALLVVLPFAGLPVFVAGTAGLALRDVAVTAPVLALLGIVAVALFKGPYVDLDPLNVYAWLLAGMLLGLYRCAGGVRSEVRA